MSELFLALSFLFVIVLIVGLFKPSLVLRWAIDENINRKSVLKYYGLAFIGMFILSSITMPFANNKNLITNQAKEDPELEEGIEDEELGQDEGEGEDKDEKSGDEEEELESVDLVGEIFQIDGKDWTDEFKFIDKEENEYFVTSDKELASENMRDALIYRIIGEKKGNKISLNNYELLAENWNSYENKLVKENEIKEIEAEIENRVSNEYSATSIKEIQIEDETSTEGQNSYIVLSYLRWDKENDSDAEITRQMLEEYSDDLSAILGKYEKIREINIFWEVPGFLEGENLAKMIYRRSGDVITAEEKWFDPLIN